MDIFFQVTWNADKDCWIATAFERPRVKGQPPTVIVSSSGDEPYVALENCCEKLGEE